MDRGICLVAQMTDEETRTEERQRFIANRRRKKKNCEMYSLRSDLNLKVMVSLIAFVACTCSKIKASVDGMHTTCKSAI